MSIAALLTFIVGVRADDLPVSSNPYAPVVARNIFGLNSIEATVVNQVIEPPVKITPNGITSGFGQVQVLFKVADKAGKETPFIFAEGQEKDGIEVVEIDWRKSVVTFNNHGLIQQLALVGTPTTPGVASNPQR